jgi:uroporphyrinogen-III decarboxylase
MTSAEKKKNPDWEHLSPNEKREVRFEGWRSPGIEFDSQEAKQQYKLRVDRFIKAIKLEEPDRVPVITPAGYFPAIYAGSTLKTVMYDYEELARCWLKFLDDFELDAFPSPGLVLSARQLEIVGHKLHHWPGNGLADDVTMYQYVEDEYMTAAEYDDLCMDQTDYLLRTFLPRTNTKLAGLAKMLPMTPMVAIPSFHFIQFCDPEIRASIQALLDMADERTKWLETIGMVTTQAMKRGVPSVIGGFSQAPFDLIGDSMRGTRGMMLDLFRHPDKILEAVDALVPIVIRSAVMQAENRPCPIVYIPLHKGTKGFMSNKQFETFYWPTLKKVMLGLIEQGLVPMAFVEGDYTERLEYIQDMPPGSVIWHFENIDMPTAKRIMNGKACIAGNIPVSLLCTGTPTEVKSACRDLIESVGQGGGYILAGAASMNEGNPDNLRAIMSAAKEYGRYNS